MPKSKREIEQDVSRLASNTGALRRKIERQISRLESVGNVEASSILKDVERQINAEGFMERIIDRRFTRQAERSTGENRWQRLSRSTIKDRMRRGFPGSRPILVRTGALYGGARAAVRGTFKFRGVVWNVGNVGVPYAKYHQSGGGKLPRRAFFNSPTAAELMPTTNRIRELIRMKIRSLMA